MPQETNLNVAPYFDDFDPQSNYYKVLFKPGYPVQARELNNLQSILQNQVEDVGNHFFKEGTQVIPGSLNYNSSFHCVQIQSEFLGIPVSLYLDQIVGKTITGRSSGVTAKVIKYITDSESERGNYTLYLSYLNSGSSDFSDQTFFDNEILVVDESINYATTFISAGEGFANTISVDSTAKGSSFSITDGVYFLRGHFVDVRSQILILDQYTNTPSYRIGLNVKEDVISSDVDPSLNDNAQGFNNYSAPGADRFRITAILAKKNIDDFDDKNFVQLTEVVNGVLKSNQSKSKNNELEKELARRTFDESGHYYVKQFFTSVKESLNDNQGNRGIYESGQITQQGNVPSDDSMVYKISPGKAYVKGFEIDFRSSILIDAPKPRTTKSVRDQAINFGFGPTIEVNRVYGSPTIGFNTTNTLSLRDQRIGDNQKLAPGKEIGLARIYDFVLESGSYDTSFPDLNKWDLSLFDVKTYTDLTLNENVTISSPTFIKGESSGATAHLRYDVNAGIALTAYEMDGQFIVGENLIFNGVIDNSRYITKVQPYTISDVQSVYGIVGLANTFTSDIIPSTLRTIGIASITSRDSQGISTVTSPSTNFVGIASVGNLVRYSVSTNPNPTIARITGISNNSLTISGVTTVTGFCEGSNPTSDVSVSDFSIIGSKLQRNLGSGNFSNNKSLYSLFPKAYIESIDLTGSSLVIRKQYSTTIVNGETQFIDSDPNEVFLPFDEERYTLIRSDGTTEVLTSDKISITNGSTTLHATGLSGSNDNNATFIATLRKNKVTSKIKSKSISESIIIDKSKLSSSGTGSTTLNDGLVYGNYPFGTRVQDSIISLNVPDVIKVHGVFESNDTSNPESPSMTVGSMDGPSSTTNDLIIGDTIIGQNSGARAIYLTRKTDTSVGFTYLNNSIFEENELLVFDQSGVTAIASNILTGSKNVSKHYTLYTGQTDSYYDYSRLIRSSQFPPATKKLRVYYSKAYYDASDTGDITTIDSYSSFNYSKEITTVNGFRLTDIIDARPRVSTYTVSENSRSPFEFEGRVFDGNQHSSKNILANDESITLSYNYYQGRADRIYITTLGEVLINYGNPDDNPKLPEGIDDGLNIANVFLPPYLFDVADAKIKFIDYKRYQMKDISNLEKRVKNLEYYSSLNLLESSTLNLLITDENGLNRFKTGIFVDNFSTSEPQDYSIGVKNSIDTKRKVLRPAHYTTALNLQLGSNAITGIGITTSRNLDVRYAEILGSNVKRTNQTVLLDYDHTEWFKQPFATRSESVTPFLVTFWQGSISLNPDVDIWVDVNRMEIRNVELDGGFLNMAEALGAEVTLDENGNRVGELPTVWESWETVDTTLVSSESTTTSQVLNFGTGTVSAGILSWQRARGLPVGDTRLVSTTTTTNTFDLSQVRQGTQEVIVEDISTESLGDRIVSREIIHFMRSRNIEFTGTRFKPYTAVYSFFDGVDVNKFTFNKLIEIEMNTGIFQVGETVIGEMPIAASSEISNISSLPSISFRVAKSNHKYGPYDNPTDIYDSNPYDRNNTIPSDYSETSTILNVDTFSLSSEENDAFGGYIKPGMILRGTRSGAQASVTNLRLVTDRVGTVIGSFRVPDSSNSSNPIFETGRSIFRLTSSSVNSLVPGTTTTSGEETFYSQGDVENRQETTLSLKNARVETREVSDERIVREIETTTESGGGKQLWPSNIAFGRWADPLAQTFYVPDSTGVFLTKVEVFFNEKDANIPVVCQIRETELGTPTTKILPYSEVALSPDKVNTSSDGTVPTVFEFETPVYLNADTEYAMVLLSNSTEYRVWISRLGETDITTLGSESGQVLVSSQPTLGSLFKSQNASVWTPSQYEDLKFTLYRANFSPQGSVEFFNPDLPDYLATISRDGITVNSRSLKIGIGTTIQDSNLTFGNTITQNGTGAYGSLVGYGGSATSTLSITNVGTGYTPSSGFYTYTGVALTSVTGTGINATADISINNGIAIGATINNGGKGYAIGDVLTPIQVGNTQLGLGMRLSVNDILGYNELILDNVQGEFETGATNYLTYENNSGITTVLNFSVGGNVIPQTPIRVVTDGLHLKVFQRNHGLNSDINYTTLSNIQPNTIPTSLSTNYVGRSSGPISIANTSVFGTFENVSVGATNPGYVKIGNEIISYTGVSGSTLTGITRGIDNTLRENHNVSDLVYKYELSGVSLRRINKTHSLSDATVQNPITLDYYYLKIDMSSNGTNRSESSPNFDALYFAENSTSGGVSAKGSYNLLYTQFIPKIRTISPRGSEITQKVRTTSGTSISGNERSYQNDGYIDIINEKTVNFDTPKLIASRTNETQFLSSQIGSKSFNISLNLSTSDTRISPALDLDHSSVIFTNNRINQPITDYANDPRVNTISDDPNNFIYLTKNVILENPATSIKVYIDAYISNFNDVRVFYALNQDLPANQVTFIPFPGWRNLSEDGTVLDFKNNDGSSDSFVPKSDIYTSEPSTSLFKEHIFTADNVQPFTSFRIKIIGTSTNQSIVPQFKNLRVIALA